MINEREWRMVLPGTKRKMDVRMLYCGNIFNERKISSGKNEIFNRRCDIFGSYDFHCIIIINTRKFKFVHRNNCPEIRSLDAFYLTFRSKKFFPR